MFIGRKDELIELNEKYLTDRLETILVSGRRRVGKSQLITESQKGFVGTVIAYECYKSTYESNLRRLEQEIKKTFNNNFLHFNNLFDVIMFLFEQSKKEKILFVVDEYPYMREGDETDSEIKNAIDAINSSDSNSPLKIIICGSSIDIMSILDDVDKPLHGRFTSKIDLKPLNYLESSLFYPSCSLDDKVKYYCVLGGIPYFLKQIDSNKSFDENIVHLFFSSNALLRTEIESQINNAIFKIEKATFVLDIIKGKTISYSDILQVYNNSYPNKSIDYVLEKLTKISVIEKIMIKQNNGIFRPYYRIKEPSLVFYYSFLNFNFANPLLFSDFDYYNTFIKDDLLHQYIPHMFEKVGFEFITLMNRYKMLPDQLLDIFTYIINDKETKSNYQFDVVGKTSAGLINYECKYQDSIASSSKIKREERQAELCHDNFIKTVFITKKESEYQDNESYSLKDMYAPILLSIVVNADC